MKTLTLSLKKEWFEMIQRGEKLEEYREFTEYWIKRLLDHSVEYDHYLYRFKNFDKLVFTLGYPKADDTSRRMEFNNPKIRIGEGRPEWGAEPGKMYFVITWEK